MSKNREEKAAANKAYRETHREKIAAQRKAYREANREVLRARKKAHYLANREHHRVKNKAWGEANREKKIAYAKDYYLANRDRMAADNKTYRTTNRDKMRALAISYYSTRDGHLRTLLKMDRRRRHLVLADLIAIWDRQGGYCALTGSPMTHEKGKGVIPTNASIDRVDRSRGYDIDNIRLICVRANFMRGVLTDDELQTWCRAIIGTLGSVTATASSGSVMAAPVEPAAVLAFDC